MSFLKKVFGRKKEQEISTDKSIQDLQNTEDILHKKSAFLEDKIIHEHDLAKENASKNKRIAMQALKRKKRLEQQLEQVMATILTLENQRTTLENSHINAEILGTMKDASKAIKKANEKLDIDKVNSVIDDISEVNDQANEITNALSTLLVSNGDDDEFERELEKLKQEALNENLLDIPKKLPALPNVPVEEPKRATNKSKDDDLNELLQWAN